MCVYMYNLLSPFGVASMCMCLDLTAWNWITYQRAHLRERPSLALSASLSCLKIFIYEWSLVKFPYPFGTSTGIVIVKISSLNF